jgi:hypothetical protein
MTRNNARIIAKYLREAGWSEVTALRQELAASKARVQEMGRRNATEAEHFRAICRRIEDSVSIMTTGHAALSDETNEPGRWRDSIEGYPRQPPGVNAIPAADRRLDGPPSRHPGWLSPPETSRYKIATGVATAIPLPARASDASTFDRLR